MPPALECLGVSINEFSHGTAAEFSESPSSQVDPASDI
jgi:hypothetical protein